MKIDKMVEILLDGWEKRGYSLKSDTAFKTIGLMVMATNNPSNSSVEAMQAEILEGLSYKVLYNTGAIFDFVGDREIIPEHEYVEWRNEGVPAYRIYAGSLAGQLAEDFKNAYLLA